MAWVSYIAISGPWGSSCGSSRPATIPPHAVRHTARQVKVADLDMDMPSMVTERPGLGPLAELVDRCLRKRKDERMPSAGVLLRELERLVAPAVRPVTA